MLPLVVAWCSIGGVSIRYVVPVSRMTSCLPLIVPAKAMQVGYDVQVTYQEVATDLGGV